MVNHTQARRSKAKKSNKRRTSEIDRLTTNQTIVNKPANSPYALRVRKGGRKTYHEFED